MRRIRSGFALEVFDHRNARSPELANYIGIYVKNFGREHRTKTNEILEFLVSPPDDRRMVCLGLKHDGVPTGFALLTWFSNSGVGVIDHLVVEPGHRGHGAFFCFSDLIASYLERARVRIEHLVAEIIVDERYIVSNIKPNILIRLMRIVGFKVAKIKYWAPDPLIVENKDGCRAALMIASQPARAQMTSTEFLEIIGLIYDRHYAGWYVKTMQPDQFQTYDARCKEARSDIEKATLKEEVIKLNGMRDLERPFELDSIPRADMPTVAFILVGLIPAVVGAAVAFKQEASVSLVTAIVTLLLVAICALTPRLRRPLLRLFRLTE